MGLIRHLNRRAEVKTLTLPSVKVAYINWLSHEYVACVTETSRGIHCRRFKCSDFFYNHSRVHKYAHQRIISNSGIITCLRQSNFVASYIAIWDSWTTRNWTWSWWNWTFVSAKEPDIRLGGICKNLLVCLSQVSIPHTHNCHKRRRYVSHHNKNTILFIRWM